MEFIAAVQIIVYVGGIVVLILFSIFLTQQGSMEMPKPSPRRMLFSVLSVICGTAFTCLLICQHTFPLPSDLAIDVSPNNIGTQMMDYQGTGYSLPFEVISILLLAAMVGCITIAIKSTNEES